MLVDFFIFKSVAYVFLMIFLPVAWFPIMTTSAESLYFMGYYLVCGVELIAPICCVLTAPTLENAVLFGRA